MADFGKHDSSGRSSGNLNGRIGKWMRPPKDAPWIWHTRELLESDAWRLRSRNCVRFIDALLIDHMSKAGRENGNLCSTYDQLQSYGIPRSKVCAAIEEAIFLGLVKCTFKGGRYGSTNKPSTYQLTFYPTKDFAPATNRWKSMTEKKLQAWRAERKAANRAKQSFRTEKQFSGTNGVTSLDPPGGLVPRLISVSESWNWQEHGNLELAS